MFRSVRNLGRRRVAPEPERLRSLLQRRHERLPFLLGLLGDLEVLVRIERRHVGHQLVERQRIPEQRVRLLDQIVVGDIDVLLGGCYASD
jgi:hypothetical protein